MPEERLRQKMVEVGKLVTEGSSVFTTVWSNHHPGNMFVMQTAVTTLGVDFHIP